MNTGSCLGTLLVIAALTAFGRDAAADTRRECIASNEAAQAMRDERKLVKAREIYLQCARDACPKLIRTDCAESVRQLDTRIPTIIVQATDRAGKDVLGVKVSIDGEVVQESLDGRALMVDPGVHWFRFETLGQEARELQVVAVEGERDRKIAVSFAPEPVAQPETTPPAAVSASAPQQRGPARDHAGQSKGAPIGAYVLGGAGLAVIGAGAYLYLTGLSQRSDGIDNGCGTADQCDSEKKSIRTRLVVGDVLTAFGIVGLASGIVWAVKASRRESAPDKSTHAIGRPFIDVHPSARGASVSALFTF